MLNKKKILSEKFIYYAAFPTLMVGLCVVSYFLGMSRGQQLANQALFAKAKSLKIEPIEMPKEYTFMEHLNENPKPQVKAVENPLALIQDDAKKEVGTNSIQMSAFKDVGKAQEFVDRLRSQGYRAFLISDDHEPRWHRVFVGPYPSTDEAKNHLKNLEAKGFGKGIMLEKETQVSEKSPLQTPQVKVSANKSVEKKQSVLKTLKKEQKR